MAQTQVELVLAEAMKRVKLLEKRVTELENKKDFFQLVIERMWKLKIWK